MITSTIRKRSTYGIFLLLPTVILYLVAEITVRLMSLDRPSIIAGGSGVGPDSIVRVDGRLGWSLKPNARVGDIATNSIGLRSPEVFPKMDSEFRILSLGESTTFGIGVSDTQTYSAQLQAILGALQHSRKITVVNAGVSAYSSFQSVRYLEERGLNLKPDMVIFYHEVNDYLPTSIRDTALNEVGVDKTDKELYDSKLLRFGLFAEQYSGLYRFLSYSYSRKRIDQLKNTQSRNPVSKIGMANTLFTSRIAYIEENKNTKIETAFPTGGMKNLAFGATRVTEAERLENLKKLQSICAQHGIRLLIVHPSYKPSTLHECVLTRFCRDNNVLMFEAFHSLHPEGASGDDRYLDSVHPSQVGHKTLAEDLARFVYDQALI